MNIKIKHLAGLLFLAVLIVSCSEEFFDNSPGGHISPNQHYNTKIDAQVTAQGAFGLLQDVTPNFIVATALSGDLTDVTSNADKYLREINEHNCSASNPYINPTGYYRIIINCNEGIKHFGEILGKDQDFTELTYKIYIGKLVGLRSWAYYTLVRLFGEAAYIPDNMQTLPEDASLQYVGKEAMLDTLVKHLSPYLDIDYDIGDIPSIYNKALLGEIYLDKEDYPRAAANLLMALQGYENKLFKVDARYKEENWQNIFVNSLDNVYTVMVAVPFSLDNQQANPLERSLAYDMDYQIKPTDNIVDAFNSQVTVQDNLGDFYRGNDVSYRTEGNDLVINKYSLNTSVRFSSHIILYRAADIHMLFAEALNRMGQYENAMSILNEGYRTLVGFNGAVGIRGRVYLKNLEVPAGVDQMTYIEDLIIKERSLELAFEGKRWFDLMRIAKRRNDNAYLADKVAAKFSDPVQAEEVRSRLLNEENWYFPFQ